MLIVKGSSLIKTNRNMKGFRSVRMSTGVPMAHLDLQRINAQGIALTARRLRFFWLTRQWAEHMEHCRLGKRW
jgi:hypothetical protein